MAFFCLLQHSLAKTYESPIPLAFAGIHVSIKTSVVVLWHYLVLLSVSPAQQSTIGLGMALFHQYLAYFSKMLLNLKTVLSDHHQISAFIHLIFLIVSVRHLSKCELAAQRYSTLPDTLLAKSTYIPIRGLPSHSHCLAQSY